MVLRSLWSDVDKNADGKLDRKEIRALLEGINYQLNDLYFEAVFKRHDKDKSNTVELKEFLELMAELTTHPAVDSIFKKYKIESELMSIEEFARFLREDRKVKMTIQ
jgi:phosphatidylinositol phospholipase C delta